MKKSKKKGLKLSTLKGHWQVINGLVFSGGLQPCVLRITRSTHYFGNCVVLDTSIAAKIAIYVSGPLHANSPNILLDTLAHEMVHQWQYENGLRFDDNHDDSFLQWIPKIKEVMGFELQKTW